MNLSKLRNLNILFSAAALVLSATAFADHHEGHLVPDILGPLFKNEEAPAAKTRYDRILEMYDQGKMVTFEEAKGWWSGRCFAMESKDTAQNFLLLADYVQVQEGAGPEFPALVAERIAALGHSGQGPEFFDNLTPEFVKELEIQAPVFLKTSGDAEEVDRSLSSLMEDKILQVRTRKNGDYLISVGYVSAEGSQYKVGDLVHVCYAFKKIH